MFVTLVVGLGENLSAQWRHVITSAPADKWIEAYIAVLGASILYALIAWILPDWGSQMLTGVFGMNFSQAPIIAGGAVATMGAAKVANYTGAEVAGAASAIRAATQVAIDTARRPGGNSSSTSNSIVRTASNALAGAGIEHEKSIRDDIRNRIDARLAMTHGGRIAERIRKNHDRPQEPLPKPPPNTL